MRGAAFAFIPLIFLGLGLLIQRVFRVLKKDLGLTIIVVVLLAVIVGLVISQRQQAEYNRSHPDCQDVRGAKVGSLACNYVEEIKALEKSKE